MNVGHTCQDCDLMRQSIAAYEAQIKDGLRRLQDLEDEVVLRRAALAAHVNKEQEKVEVKRTEKLTRGRNTETARIRHLLGAR